MRINKNLIVEKRNGKLLILYAVRETKMALRFSVEETEAIKKIVGY